MQMRRCQIKCLGKSAAGVKQGEAEILDVIIAALCNLLKSQPFVLVQIETLCTCSIESNDSWFGGHGNDFTSLLSRPDRNRIGNSVSGGWNCCKDWVFERLVI